MNRRAARKLVTRQLVEALEELLPPGPLSADDLLRWESAKEALSQELKRRCGWRSGEVHPNQLPMFEVPNDR